MNVPRCPRIAPRAGSSGALARVLRRGIAAGLSLVVMALPALAQRTPDWSRRDWSWSALRAIPQADTARVGWLERNVPLDSARALLSLVAELSQPEAAQLLPAFLYADASMLVSPVARTWRDSLYTRPPAGDAGIVHVAYLAARMHRESIDSYRGVYAPEFIERPFALPPATAFPRNVSRRPRSDVVLDLSFDFAPAETLLAIVSTPDITVAEAHRRISTPAFDAMVRHRNQPFYPIAFTRELLAENLASAASTRPLERLYTYAMPGGLLHFADVARNRDRYRAQLDTLRAREREIFAHVAREVAPFLPAGARVQRRVSFYFGEGADGWGSSGVVALDLEFYKSDWRRLIELLVHETFHAAQGAVRPQGARSTPATTAPDSALRLAFEYLLGEGTANFVSPARGLTRAEADSIAAAGAALLAQVHAATRDPATYDRAAVRDLLNRGVSGGGAFYWLGAEMSRVIVETLGAPALAATLRDGGVAFVKTYLRALDRSRSAPRRLSSELVATIRAIES
jgi:hypothetical protein